MLMHTLQQLGAAHSSTGYAESSSLCCRLAAKACSRSSRSSQPTPCITAAFPHPACQPSISPIAICGCSTPHSHSTAFKPQPPTTFLVSACTAAFRTYTADSDHTVSGREQWCASHSTRVNKQVRWGASRGRCGSEPGRGLEWSVCCLSVLQPFNAQWSSCSTQSHA